jgi:peptidoglycan/xylan/chitin deacetylase (PgdA/CDA1 family)
MNVSRPLRSFTRHVTRRITSRCIVLMYHRVAEIEHDPWGLCVTPENFAAQLSVLAAHYRPLTLAQAGGHIANGTFPRSSVVVTFDDGYADNLHCALPLLAAAGVPATVFVTTGQIDSDREFWWDELGHLLLGTALLPARIDLNLGERERSWRTVDAGSNAGEIGPATRLKLYRKIWALLQPLEKDARRAVLDNLAQQLHAGPVMRDDHRTLSSTELQVLSAAEVVDIGAHTVTHPLLCIRQADLQHQEMQESKSRLEELTGKPVEHFSYPFGDHDDAVVRTADSVGFRLACTTETGDVRRDTDPLRMPRIQVADMDGDVFARWMNGL